MGLMIKKFPGDAQCASGAEIASWVDAIESVNRSTSTVFFCITPFEQTQKLMQILKARGYPESEILVLHKQWKSDKVVSGGFVSALLYVVVAYKDKAATWGGVTLPEPVVEKLKWRQNLWTLPKVTKPQVDELGNKVNLCPQDPLVVERLVKMFRPRVIFSHGEGAGWGAPVALKTGVDYICTEPDNFSYNFLVRRLQRLSGELVCKEGQQQAFFKRVHQYCVKTKAEDSKAGTREAIATIVMSLLEYRTRWLHVLSKI